MGISGIGHAHVHMRDHARSLNPLAHEYLISPDANFPLRQFCAPLRSSRSGSATRSLTALYSRPSNAPCNHRQQSESVPLPSRCPLPMQQP